MTLYLKASSQEQVKEVTEDAKVEASTKDKLRVLVVEDDAEVRNVTTEMLESFGYSTVEAKDAFEAVELLQSDARIDLMLSDIGLPGGMNGIQLADKISHDQPALPIVLMTGYQSEQENGEGYVTSAQKLIHKPFSKAELSAAIKSAL